MVKNVTLQKKLLTGFIATSLVTLFVGMFAITRFESIESADARLYERATAPMKDLVSIVEEYYKMRIVLRDIVNNEKAENIQRNINEIKRMQKNLSVKIDAIGKTLISSEGVGMLNEFKHSSATYESASNKMIDLMLGNKYADAKVVLDTEVVPAAAAYQKHMDRIVETKNKYAKILADSNKELAESTGRYLYCILAASLIFSIGLGILLTRSVMQQLGEDPGYLASVAGEIAGGNLDVTFRMEKKPGGVYHVLQGMVRTMKDKIAEAEEKVRRPFFRPIRRNLPCRRPKRPRSRRNGPRSRVCFMPPNNWRALSRLCHQRRRSSPRRLNNQAEGRRNSRAVCVKPPRLWKK